MNSYERNRAGQKPAISIRLELELFRKIKNLQDETGWNVSKVMRRITEGSLELIEAHKKDGKVRLPDALTALVHQRDKYESLRITPTLTSSSSPEVIDMLQNQEALASRMDGMEQMLKEALALRPTAPDTETAEAAS